MTMTAIAPPMLVTGATRQARPYGLFSVVAFPESPAAPRFESGVQWERLACDQTPSGLGIIGGALCGASVPDGLPKTFDGTAGTSSALPFTVYGHHVCSPTGWSPSQAQDRAVQHLTVHEERAVEYTVWTGLRGVAPSFVDLAVDTTSGPTSPALALGALERHAADEYGSLPVLHIGIETASVLFAKMLLTVRAGRCFTMTGIPVVIGSGYPGTGPGATPGAAPAAGQQWGYMTPALFGYRSEVFTSSAVSGDLLDRRKNDLYSVAERTYIIGFDDCGVGAALFDLTAA